MTSEQVLVEMNRLGLRPADLRELLSLGVQQPKLLQEKHLIVALGDVFQINGDRLVAYLSRSDSVRDLNLDWFDDEWSGICRFAAVRK